MAEEGKAQSLTLKQTQKAPAAKSEGGPSPAASSKGSLADAGAKMDDSMNIAKALVMSIVNPMAMGKLVLAVLPDEAKSGPMKAMGSMLGGLGSIVSGKMPNVPGLSSGGDAGSGGTKSGGGSFLATFQGAVKGGGKSGFSRVAKGAEAGLDKGGDAAIKGGKALGQKGAALSSTLLGAIIGVPMMIVGGATMGVGATGKVTSKVSKGTRGLLAVGKRTVRLTGKAVKAVRAKYKAGREKLTLIRRKARRMVRKPFAPLRVRLKLVGKRTVRITGKAMKAVRAKYKAGREKLTLIRRKARRMVRKPFAPLRVRLKLVGKKIKAVRKKVTLVGKKIRRVVKRETAGIRMAYRLAQTMKHKAEEAKHRQAALKASLMGDHEAAASHKAQAKGAKAKASASFGKFKKIARPYARLYKKRLLKAGARFKKGTLVKAGKGLRLVKRTLQKVGNRLAKTRTVKAILRAKRVGRVIYKRTAKPFVRAAARGRRMVAKVKDPLVARGQAMKARAKSVKELVGRGAKLTAKPFVATARAGHRVGAAIGRNGLVRFAGKVGLKTAQAGGNVAKKGAQFAHKRVMGVLKDQAANMKTAPAAAAAATSQTVSAEQEAAIGRFLSVRIP